MKLSRTNQVSQAVVYQSQSCSEGQGVILPECSSLLRQRKGLYRSMYQLSRKIGMLLLPLEQGTFKVTERGSAAPCG